MEETEDITAILLSFGEEVCDEAFLDELKFRVWSELLHRPTKTPQFPGSQPVSFTRAHLNLLEREDYYVCEKSDGIRYLLYYTSPYGNPTAFLIDRNFQCRELRGLTLPARIAGKIHEDTLLDGELIVENREGVQNEFLFLIFDALLINGKCIMPLSLPDRLKYVQNDVVFPIQTILKESPSFEYPFKIDIKKMWKPYAIAEILEIEIPKLHHDNDGLIFTPVADPYVSGTCGRLLKWKPSKLNSVDFKLVVHQETEREQRFELQVCSGNSHRFFCYHKPDMKLEGLDGQIIECRYSSDSNWEFIRIRRDKTFANHERVVEKIMNSIRDNVTADELIQKIPIIRRAWKARESEASPQLLAVAKRRRI